MTTQYAWKGLCVFLLVVSLLQFYLLLSEGGIKPDLPTRPLRAPHTSPPKKAHSKLTQSEPLQPERWSYRPQRDARNSGLSLEQCDEAFPKLYYEVERATAFWKKRKHTITADDIDISWRNDAAFKVMIFENQLRVTQTKNSFGNDGYRKRSLFVLNQMQRALLGAAAAGEQVPNMEFAVTVDDISLIPNARDDTHSIFAFSRRKVDKDQDRVWLMPDFNFFAAPPTASSWMDMQRRAALHDGYIIDKIPGFLWRGVKWTNEYVRGHLIDATKNKEWADVQEVDWENKTNFVRMDELCKYMFVVHTEGRSWSGEYKQNRKWMTLADVHPGRLKYLLNCHSVPIVHDLDWTTPFYHILKADGGDQNYVRVKRDFSDLESKIEWYMKNPGQAQHVADNAIATFRDRYTSPAAEACYWRRLLRGWSEVAFVPEPFENVVVNFSSETGSERRLRGVTFEEVVLHNEQHPIGV